MKGDQKWDRFRQIEATEILVHNQEIVTLGLNDVKAALEDVTN
jgi:hypothetical protein